MRTLIKFELMKILGKKLTWLAIGVSVVFFIFTFLVSVFSSSAEGWAKSGKTLTGIAAIQWEKEALHSLAGDLTVDRLSEIIGLRNSILSDPKQSVKIENGTQEGQMVMTDEATDKWQKYKRIEYLLMQAYSPVERFDPSCINRLFPVDASHFYTNRIVHIEEKLRQKDSGIQRTDTEIETFTAMAKSLKTPMYYDYNEGWDILINALPVSGLFLCVILVLALSPVFAGEYQTGADALILCSKHGKRKAIHAKLIASFLFLTGLAAGFWLFVAILWISPYGITGWNCPVQIAWFHSVYNLNFLQASLLMAFIMWIGLFLLGAMTLLLSAKLKSPFVVMAVSVGLLFIPMVIPSGVPYILQKIIALFPIKFMQGKDLFQSYTAYNLFGQVLVQPMFIVLFGIAASAVMLPFAYRAFRKHQVG